MFSSLQNLTDSAPAGLYLPRDSAERGVAACSRLCLCPCGFGASVNITCTLLELFSALLLMQLKPG